MVQTQMIAAAAAAAALAASQSCHCSGTAVLHGVTAAAARRCRGRRTFGHGSAAMNGIALIAMTVSDIV